MRLLDLFCGAGGAAVGYRRAGFTGIVGVDINPQPNYPFEFIQSDAMVFMDDILNDEEFSLLLGEFDVIHASPPCQAYSAGARMRSGYEKEHPKLIEPVREFLVRSGLPYVIENVVGAPFLSPIRICGSQFGLGVRRHRLFESNMALFSSYCTHDRQDVVVGVYGDHPEDALIRKGHPAIRAKTIEHAKEVMGIDWMQTWQEVKEAIPPAYTQYIGEQLVQQLTAQRMAT